MSFLQQSCEQTIFLILTQQSEGWKNGVALSENIYKVIFAMDRSKFQTILNIAFCFISLPLLWPLIKTLCYFAGSYRKRQLYQVKVNFEIESPMSQNDYIKNVYILADGNPSPDVAKLSFSPEMGVCSATTRMRLSKTQNVYLLAENNNNQFFMTKSMVKVTIGGCGG